MRTFACRCGATVFFENDCCISCGSELGWCPACRALVAISAGPDGAYICSGCGGGLKKCRNSAESRVCNRCLPAGSAGALCDCCRFNDTIPDLSVAGNHEKWLRLELGKRRLLYTLDLLGLPYGNADDGVIPELSFDFKQDGIPARRWWWALNREERVHTGHARGKITINLREADHVEREKVRVSFEEAHRTVIGHFRHEIGHYYWEMFIRDQAEEECAGVFGDHRADYGEAMQRYYREGPDRDRSGNYISGYAAMHPWEDFAETFATYLDAVSVLDTARNMGISGVDPRSTGFEPLFAQYAKLGVVLNEMNRAMGLLDLVPEVFTPPVLDKLSFVHRLVRANARSTAAARA